MAVFIFYMLLVKSQLLSSYHRQVCRLWYNFCYSCLQDLEKKISDGYYYINIVEWSASEKDVATNLEMKQSAVVYCGIF